MRLMQPIVGGTDFVTERRSVDRRTSRPPVCMPLDSRSIVAASRARATYLPRMNPPLLAANTALSASRSGDLRGTVPALLESMRPRQWVKNVFVLAGLVFGSRLFDVGACTRASLCFLLFCAA